MSQFNHNNPKSRFQVTPRDDIESQSFVLKTTPPTSTTGTTSPTTPPPTSAEPCDSLYSPFFNGNFFSNVDEGFNEKQNSHNNTATTSSNSSFYNTIYKYNKLKQTCPSIDAYPLVRRKLSHLPNSVIGISFYNERVLVYNFLQRPTGTIAIGYHIFVSIAIVYCLVLTIMSTSAKYTNIVSKWLNTIDFLIITFFVIEFMARLWASECVSYYRGWKGKVRFFKNPIRIIDLCVIIVSVAVIILNAKGELIITSLRGVRFIQIFQMVRLDFKFRPWRMMASVVYSQRIHLAIVFYMGFLALIFVSFVIYFVEKDENEDFDSLASSMWWSVITLCTIGYGDMYPKTSTGKMLACLCSLIGVSIFALPAGILGTGLALKVQEQQRQLKISKRKQPAARLIQCAWKFYISNQEMKRTMYKFNINDNTIGKSLLWKRFETNKNKARPLSRKETNGLHFIFAVKLSIAKNDFVKAFKPYDIKDVLEQYAAGHADMLAKIRIMDHRLEKIQANTISSKSQYEFRLRFAAHLTKLEYEMQKIQMNFNEMLRYQVDSRLVIENLLKYLIDQQITSSRNKQGCCSFASSSNGERCSMCQNHDKETARLVSQFDRFDLSTKLNQTFTAYNENILAHLRSLPVTTNTHHQNGQHHHQKANLETKHSAATHHHLHRRRKSF